MPNLKVFDPAMCCSTGVCGPEVDPELVRFAADVDWLKSQGVQVDRYDLGHEPSAFTGEPLVQETLRGEGVEALPLILVDGAVASRGRYPGRQRLAALAGLDSASLLTPAVTELVALAAAMAANSEARFEAHFDQASVLSVTAEDLHRVVEIALAVKAGPARQVRETADRAFASLRERGAETSSCCAPTLVGLGGGKGCC